MNTDSKARRKIDDMAHVAAPREWYRLYIKLKISR